MPTEKLHSAQHLIEDGASRFRSEPPLIASASLAAVFYHLVNQDVDHGLLGPDTEDSRLLQSGHEKEAVDF